VGLWPPFFHLTSTFFGLTSDYKVPLLEEVYICMQHLKMNYSDVLCMPTYERRFFLSLLMKQNIERQEEVENANKTQTNSKGNRKTSISGDALKSRMKSGDIPLN
jgi:hypothetical protein